MIIEPLSIEQEGPGIDLTNQPGGVSIQMADSNPDLAYARNGVTLTYDLSAAVTASLTFEAMEFGDEPHYPRDGSGIENRDNVVGFGPVADFDFDGVAISADGAAWYEIQDLRSLRASGFTAYDLDLVAIAVALGLGLGSAFRLRFCQYDNNPAPKDGIFLRNITVEADVAPVEPSVEVSISSGTDDQHGYAANGTPTSGVPVLAAMSIPVSTTLVTLSAAADRDNATIYHCPAWRFNGVTIPQGATITSATLTIYSGGVTRNIGFGGPPMLSASVRGRAVDSAPAISTADYRAAAFTAASVAWTPSYLDWATMVARTSPDISSVISEITGRPGWSNGNSIWLDWFLDSWSGIDGDRRDENQLTFNVLTYETDSVGTYAPVLNITYS